MFEDPSIMLEDPSLRLCGLQQLLPRREEDLHVHLLHPDLARHLLEILLRRRLQEAYRGVAGALDALGVLAQLIPPEPALDSVPCLGAGRNALWLCCAAARDRSALPELAGRGGLPVPARSMVQIKLTDTCRP